MANNPDYQVISFRVPRDFAKHLHSLVISCIKQKGKMYTLSDLIRDTLEKNYPTPKQLDMFEDKKA